LKTEPSLQRRPNTPKPEQAPAKQQPLPAFERQASRGVIGRIFLGLFIIWNVAMIIWFVATLTQLGKTQTPTDDFEALGAALGSMIALRLIGTTWAMGSTILGIPALLTRP
jgi:hypothetical protein